MFIAYDRVLAPTSAHGESLSMFSEKPRWAVITRTPLLRWSTTEADSGEIVTQPVTSPVDSRPREYSHRNEASSPPASHQASSAVSTAASQRPVSGVGRSSRSAPRTKRSRCRSRLRTRPSRTMSVSKIPSPRRAARSSMWITGTVPSTRCGAGPPAGWTSTTISAGPAGGVLVLMVDQSKQVCA